MLMRNYFKLTSKLVDRILISAPLIIGILSICMLNSGSLALDIELEFDQIDANDALPSELIKSSDSAYAQNIKGLDALESGSYDAAIKHFSRAFSLLPGYWDAENNRGVAYFRKGNIVLAKDIWEVVVAKDPRYAIGVYNLGVVAYHEQNYDVALNYFKTAMRRRRNFSEAMVMLGRIHLTTGNNATALDVLVKAYKNNSSDQNVWSTYAYALIQSQDTTAAEKILRKQEKAPEAYQMLGQIAFARKQYDTAIRLLTKSVALGGSASLLYQIAEAELERGSCIYALKAMEKYFARAAKPGADAWLVAGVAAKECDKTSLAKDYFSKGVASFPRDPFLRLNLGHIYFRERKYNRAEEMWATLSDTIQDPALFHLRAIAARYQNDLSSAESLIRKALALDPKAEYYDFYGVVLHQKGKKKEAVLQFKKALKRDPLLRSAQLNLALSEQSSTAIAAGINNTKQRLDTCREGCPDIALELSILYFQDKKVSQAIAILENIPVGKRSEKIYKHLALFLTNLQRWDDAINILEKARKDLVLDLSTETQLVNCYMKAGSYGKAIQVLKDLLVHWDGNRWRIYYQLGYAYLEQNKLNTALKHFKLSLKSRNKNPAARGMLAFIYNRTGQSGKARGLWKQNLEDDPNNPTIWINMGLLLENEGKYSGAIANYEKAYSLDKSNKVVYINIGNAYAEMKKYRDARIAYSMVLDSPKRKIAAYNTFISAQKEKNHAITKKMMAILKAEYPQSPYYKRARSEMLLWDEDTTRAIAILEKVPEKNMEDNYTLARLYISQSKLGPAQKYMKEIPQNKQWQVPLSQLHASLSFAKKEYKAAYEQFKAIKDTSFYHQYNMALAAFKSGYHNKTITLLEKKVQHVFGKDKADALRLLGNAHFTLKQWQKARLLYLQLSAIESKKAVVQYNLAVASYHLGKVHDAWKYYQNARSLDPHIKNDNIEKGYYATVNEEQGTTLGEDSLEIIFNQAADYQDKGNDSIAEYMYFQILKKDKNHSHTLNNLGTLYGSQAAFEKSIKYYKKAIEYEPGLGNAYVNLIKVHIALDELDEAKAVLFKGKMHNPYDTLLVSIEDVLQRALDGEDVLGMDSDSAQKD